MQYQIIEHPTRGVYMEFDHHTEKPRFSWSKSCLDDTVMPFYSEYAIKRTLAKFPDNIRERCRLVTIELSNGKRRVIRQ